MSMESYHEMSKEEWYERAQKKAEEIALELDPQLQVEVKNILVSKEKDAKEPKETLALKFSHKENPDMKWTMEIGENDEYIEKEMKETIQKIYLEQIKAGIKH